MRPALERRSGVTVAPYLPAVPTMLQRLFDEPQVERFGLPSLDCIMTGGAPVPAELLRRVERATGSDTVLLTGYGLTKRPLSSH